MLNVPHGGGGSLKKLFLRSAEGKSKKYAEDEKGILCE